MERANIVEYLASSADDLIATADTADQNTATALLREAAELLALGSLLLNKDRKPKLSVIAKEAA